jgi:hypothetical protein
MFLHNYFRLCGEVGVGQGCQASKDLKSHKFDMSYFEKSLIIRKEKRPNFEAKFLKVIYTNSIKLAFVKKGLKDTIFLNF